MIVFMYHSIQATDLNQSRLIVREEYFKKQIDFIARKYKVIDIRDMGKYLTDDKAALITFDDGYIDNYTIAYKYFEQKKLPFTIFLATNILNTTMQLRGVTIDGLTNGMIEEMHSSGLAYFGSHTHSHLQFDQNNPETLIADIENNIKIINNIVGYEPDYFCYPKNRLNSSMVDYLSSKFELCFQDSGIVNPFGDPLRVNRIELTDKTKWWKMLWRYYKIKHLYYRLRGYNQL